MTTEKPDQLVPDSEIMREFAISPMTLWRWDHNPRMAVAGWPPAIRIRTRKFRSRHATDQFKANMAERAIAERRRDLAAATG